MTNATAQLGDLEVNDIAELRRGFEIALLARNRSPKTIKSYLEGLDLFRSFAVNAGFPTTVDRINRDHVETFLADQLAAGDRRPRRFAMAHCGSSSSGAKRKARSQSRR